MMSAGLPSGYTVRPAGLDDLEAVYALYLACSLAEHGSLDFTHAELLSTWQGAAFTFATDSWVVVAPDGSIAGYADAGIEQQSRINFGGRVHPEHSGRGIGRYLVRAGEGWGRRYAETVPSAERVTLRQWLPVANEAACHLLASEGYTVIRRFWRMRIDMDAPPPPPRWPAGITVRAFVAGRDERAVHAAVQDAFHDHWDHGAVPFDRWRQREIERDDFDAALWLLAMADNSTIGGVAHSRMNGDMGFVDELGVCPAWRRLGIARALLGETFATFYRRGVFTVGLGVDAQSSTGAPQLYMQAGMRMYRQWDVHEKIVRA